MNRLLRLFAASAVVAALASVLGAAALAGSGGGTSVEVAKSPLGTILVDRSGRTLYDFVADHGKTSVCYGACAALWPPLFTTGKPLAGNGVKASLLGTTKRSDGKLEVTYAGHPLYYYVADSHRGQTTGQGLNQFGAPWWVLAPSGKEIHRG
jgi:predicted lipoprotein with Yx(FWY)xxD motif